MHAAGTTGETKLREGRVVDEHRDAAGQATRRYGSGSLQRDRGREPRCGLFSA